MNDYKLTVFYGTETGNCKGLAAKVAAKGAKNGVSVTTIDLAGCDPSVFADLDHPALIIISTWDDGAPPPKCHAFHTALMQADADYSALRYCVLALGDAEYPLYCECGKQIDEKLATLGAERLMPRTDLGADFMVSYISWSKAYWRRMAVVYGVAAA